MERQLTMIAGVSDIHDLHVWMLTSGVVAMSAHAVVGDATSGQTVLEAAHTRLANLGIQHITMQLEREADCPSVTIV